MNRNPFEEAARATKALALLGALDRQAAFVGMPPLAGKRGVEALAAFKAAEWRALAREANVRAPSKATIDLVVEAIERRGAVRKTTPVPAQLSLVPDSRRSA